MRRKIVSAVLGGALLALALEVQAHAPRFACYAEEGEQIFCEGGFSDGSSARGIGISVVSYEDKLLWSGQLDEKSQIRFKRPADGFFVRFNGGDGHSLEIDQHDIQ